MKQHASPPTLCHGGQRHCTLAHYKHVASAAGPRRTPQPPPWVLQRRRAKRPTGAAISAKHRTIPPLPSNVLLPKGPPDL
jgi:hypothetical protein